MWTARAPQGGMSLPLSRCTSAISTNRCSISKHSVLYPIPVLRGRGECRVRAAVVDSSQGEAFEADVIQASHNTPVLVDFWATWCGPCKLVAPSMVWAANEFDGSLQVVKIDCTDGNKELMEAYKVYGLPCLIVFKDGAMVQGSHREGAITKKGLVEYLEKHCGLVTSSS